MLQAGCPLCDASGGRVIAQSARWRLVHADEAGFPAFYRLVWQEHVREFSQLPAAERHECADLLAAIEQVMLRELQPTKMNVATLGNMVPHLHWHLIARFDWDTHFPGPVWAAPQRPPDAARLQALSQALPTLEESLRSVLPNSG